MVVYSKPVCVQCKATKRALDKAGVEYVEIDLTKDSEALEKVKALGYQQAPVVITSKGVHWSGYRPDKIKEIAEKASIERK